MIFKNFLSSFLVKLWAVFSNFLFIPYYIHYLGIDNFSVISFSLIIISVLMVLDMGLSAAITREMARVDISAEDKYKAFKTLEKFYLLFLLICVVVGLLAARPIAEHLIEDTPIDRKLIALCLSVIAVEGGLQLYFRFYCSALMGLEKQVAANLFTIAQGVLRNGAVVLLLMEWPTLFLFFFWQLISTFLAVLLVKYNLSRTMEMMRPIFVPLVDVTAIKRIRRFVGGVFLISIVAVINTQLDRIFISYMLPLEQLGYYTIAVTIGMGMLAISSSFYSAIQPRLTKWYSEGRLEEAGKLYIRMATIVSVLTFSLMGVIGTSPTTVLSVWTGSATVAAQASSVLPFAVAAYAFLAVANQTYGVALANAHTRYNIMIGVLSIFVLLPGYWLLIESYGILGAQILFFALQFFSATCYQFLINRRFLKFKFIRTYFQLFIFPPFLSLVLALTFEGFVHEPDESRFLMLAYLGVKYLFVVIGTASAILLLFRPHKDFP